MPSQLILFGILHCLGVAMMLYPLLAPLVERLPVWAGVLLSAALYLLTAGIGQRVLGFGPFTVPLPDALYDCGFLFPLGLHPRIFASADYYPLLPWIFLSWPAPASVAGSKTNGYRRPSAAPTCRRSSGWAATRCPSTCCTSRWPMRRCGWWPPFCNFVYFPILLQNGLYLSLRNKIFCPKITIRIPLSRKNGLLPEAVLSVRCVPVTGRRDRGASSDQPLTRLVRVPNTRRAMPERSR